MASQFYGLNISYTGLLASNAALNTTANNIANTDTQGYSRQVVNQVAGNALRTYTTFGCSGSGVDVRSIERVRDEFYDVKFWINKSIEGEYDKKQYYMCQMEDYFLDDTTVKGFKTIFDEMRGSLEELMKNAGDTTVKSQFIGYTRNLTTYFNEMAGNLTKMQEDVNSEIRIKVDEINSYAQEISSLNKQINVIELTGVIANELRDQRTVIIDKLSKVIDVEVTETPIYDTNNPERFTGAHRCIVRVAGGQILVDMNEYNRLHCVAREADEKAYQSDAVGLYDIEWENGAAFGMYNATMGGELAGLIHLRDGNNGEHFNGEISALRRDNDGYDYVTIKVKDDYLLDMKKSTLASEGIINLGDTLFKYEGWSFDPESKTYTFKLSQEENGQQVPYSKMHRQASVNQSVAFKGIPYYNQQMNEWIRLFAQAVNEILTQPNSSDEYGNPGQILLTGHLANAKELKFRKEIDGLGEITSEDDCYRLLTAENFGITSALLADPMLLATKTDAQEGQDKYDVLEELYNMTTDAERMSFRGGSADEFLEWMLADVSLNTERAKTFHSNAETMSSSIDNQRISISGVDHDEETVNLVKFQNAYNLSSKMIQVLTEIYDRLILETGV